MFIDLFYRVREAGVPATPREFLTLLEAMRKTVVGYSIDEFYYLARTTLVKDEKFYDRFDQVFGEIFEGLERIDFGIDPSLDADIPAEWLRRELERMLSDEEKAAIQGITDWQELMDLFRQRLEEQKERHQGGNKWIGTGGTSPFGAYGYNPAGIRIGQSESRHRRATKVWDKRNYRDLDDSVEVGIRNIKVALKRLRHFARTGSEMELDVDDTIRATANNAGYLDIKLVPERHNKAKVLLLFDVGGSMDYHVKVCEELFSAARSEFKHMEQFYFHNFLYDSIWRNNVRRYAERQPLWDVIHKYGSDYKLIVVGDATMSPYEITHGGGSVEFWNEEAGSVWLRRLLDQFPKAIWLNPEPNKYWKDTESIRLTRELMDGRMYSLTLEGLAQGMRYLSR